VIVNVTIDDEKSKIQRINAVLWFKIKHENAKKIQFQNCCDKNIENRAGRSFFRQFAFYTLVKLLLYYVEMW